MTENTKTITLVLSAVVLLGLAFVTRPRLPYAKPEGEVGQSIFPEWKDPNSARSLAISSYDESTAQPRSFKVAQVGGQWVIPSHENYPANAKDHVIAAATSLINLNILAVVADAKGMHETYGVVDPDPNTLTRAATGVGKLVVVQDESGKDLARLIIGKEDKPAGGSEEGQSNLRFVRRAGQDRVYLVSLATEPFSTRFEDWIDPDLLGIKQQQNINSLKVRDYTLAENGPVRAADLTAGFNDPANLWSVKQFTTFKDNKPVEKKLAADEELDSQKLSDLKMTIAGLKIVDVNRKEDGFAAKLKKGTDYSHDAEARKSLAAIGFMMVADKASADVFGAGGDVALGMNDGVEFDLRFGGAKLVLGDERGGKEKKPDGSPAKPKDKDAKGADVRRFTFVTARFNEDLIPKPILEVAPAEKKPDEQKPDANPSQKPPEDKKPEAKKADDKKPDEKAADAKKPADPKVDPKADDKKADDKKADEAKKGAEAKKSEDDLKRAQEEEFQEAERKRIQTENRHKQDAYDAQVKRGKERAREMNNLFADWYYMISEEDYKKIHVSVSDLVKKKGPAQADHDDDHGAAPRDPFLNRLGLPGGK